MVDVVAAAVLGLASPPNMATGAFTGAGNATSVTLGFDPRYFMIWNDTDATKWEKLQGMAANRSIKTVTAGTVTSDNTSAIVFSVDSGQNAPGSSVLLSAALCASGKALSWMALG